MLKSLLILTLCLSTLSLAEPELKTPFGDVSIETAKSLIESKNPPLIIDVRTAEEFAKDHIEGAVNIDVKSVEFKKQVSALDKDKVYLVHCKSGGRSSKALKVFTELGFKNIYHMNDGFMNWVK